MKFVGKKARILSWTMVALLLCLVFHGVFLATGIKIWGWQHGIRISLSPLSRLSWNTIHLRHLRIRNKQGDIFFEAPSVEITYDHTLFFHGQVAPSLHHVLI